MPLPAIWRAFCRRLGMSVVLTAKQKRLTSEIQQLCELFGIEVRRASSITKAIWRTTYLESVKRQLIRGLVIHWYTYTDEMLGCGIAWYFFGKRRSFPELWRTKRFQRLNHYILTSNRYYKSCH